MARGTLTAVDLQGFIDQHRIQASLIELSVPTPTVEAAAAALGVSPSQILKSLLFWIGEEPLLVLASGPTLVDRRELASHCGVGRKKVRLMPPEDVLAISGYPVGAVPPFGHHQPVKSLMDERVLSNALVYAGGGAEDTLMEVLPAEIQRVTAAVALDLRKAPVEPETGGLE